MPRPSRALLAGVVASAPAVITAMRVADAWVPSGDAALVALRSLDVFRGHMPLVGMPTTLGSVVDRQLYHLGPSEFLLLAAPLRVFGPPGLVAFMAAMHAACAVGVTLAANRMGGVRVAAIASVLVAGTMASVPPTVLIEVLNPYFGFPPLALFVAAVCVVVARADHRWLPVAVVTGSVAAQSHVALAAIVAGVTLAAVVLRVAGSRRRPQVAVRFRASHAVSAALGTALWLPVAVNEARNHNIAGVITGGAEDVRRIPTKFVINSVTNALTTPSWASSMSAFDFLRDPERWAVSVAFAALVALLVLAIHRRGSLALRTASWIALATVAAGVGTQSRMPDTFFAVAALHNYLWLWVAGGLVMTTLLAAVASAIPERFVVTVAALALLGIGCFAATRSVDVSPPWIAAVANARGPLLEKTGRDDQTYVVVRPDLRGYGISTGLAFALEETGHRVLVPAAHGPSFGQHRSWSTAGPVTQVLLVTDSRERPRPGAELLAEVPEPHEDLTSYVWLVRAPSLG